MKYSTRISTIVISIFILIFTFSLVLFFADIQLYGNFYNVFYVEVNENLDDIAIQMSDNQIDQFEELYNIFSNQYSNDYMKTQKILDVFQETHDGFMHVYFTNTSGKNFIANTESPNVDGREREWYIKAIGNEDLIVSKPYIDLLSHDTVITLSKSVQFQGSNRGVFGIDLNLSDFLTSLQDLYKGDFIISYENIFLETTIDAFRSTGHVNEDVIQYAELNNMEIRQFDIENYGLSIYLLNKDTILYHKSILTESTFTSHVWTVIFALIISLAFAISVLIYINKHLNDVDINDVVLPARMEKLKDLYDQLKEFFNQNTLRQDKLGIEKEKFDKRYQQLVLEYNRLEIDLNHHVKEITRLEDTYNDLITNIPDMVWVIDPEGNLVFFNDELLIQLGYRRDELNQMKLKDLIHEIDDSLLINILTKRNFKDFEMTLLSKDQQQKIIASVKTKRIYVEDNLYLIQGICKDISVDKKMFYDYYNMNKELYLLNDISKTLVNSYELNTMLKSIVDKISVLMNFDVACIGILEKSNLEIIVDNERNALVNRGKKYELDASSYEKLMSSKDYLNKDDVFNIDYKAKGYQQLLLPLKNNENDFGVLIAYKNEIISNEQISLMQSVAINATIAIEKSMIFDKLQNDYYKMIESLVNAMEIKLKSAKGHAKRVGSLSVMIGERFYLSQDELNEIYVAGLLHDIGKMGIEDQYFLDETIEKALKNREILKHVPIGKELIEDIGLTRNTIDGVFYHHLNYDLRGYPETELVEQPFIAQIIQLSNDFINALSDNKLTVTEVFLMVEAHAGSKYSPDVIHALDSIIKDQLEKLENIINN